ncbi:MAG TPA: hypothetical protein VFV50_08205, partial [Bdellovibrionales bacterium]|nr:hypothetical protein [Bdellovibrionales bacterium]
MTVDELIKAHESKAGETPLNDVFGDGYLYAENRVYRNIRDKAVALGFEYTADDFCDYNVCSLAALPEILNARKIPFLKNAGVFRKMSAKGLGNAAVSELPNIRPNYLLHESAHGIAHATYPWPAGESSAGERERVLSIMLAEAYANAVERVARYSTGDDGSAHA